MKHGELMRHTLLWLDLEMTGLSPEKDTILQCAAVVTDNQLTVIAESVEYTIYHTPNELVQMNEHVRTLHTNSGLLERVYLSLETLPQVEDALIKFFKSYCEPHNTLLCGNSIWVDRMFLKQYMPRFEALLHYRMVDVSTLKELVLRWYPTLAPFPKTKRHTAHADLRESIDELIYYQKNCFYL